MARRRLWRRSERGAVAVEAGLLSTFLMPLMAGVLFWGNYLWKAQDVNLYAARLDPNAIVGVNFTCSQLTDLVEQAVLDNVTQIAGQNLPQLSLQDITATVDRVLPTVGADITVQISVPVVDSFTSLLPHDGRVVEELSFRLENVTLTTETCH